MPPGEAGGIKGEGLLELDKAQGFADAAVDFVVGDALLDELVSHIVADGERIEERALLEDHAGAGAQGKELFLGHGGDFFAEEQDAALVGAEQAVGQLEQDALAHAGGPEQDARLSRRYGEADVLKHRRAVEGDGDVAKDHHGAGIRGRSRVVDRTGRKGQGGGGEFIHQAKRESRTWVRRKSTKMMSTEDADDGLDGGAAHALGAARGSHAVEAADGGDDVAGEERLDQSLDDVGIAEATPRPWRSTGGRPGGS